MSWLVVLTNIAEKQLWRIPREYRKRIDGILQEMRENPFRGDVIKLGGGGERWRRRIGAYRVIYIFLKKKGPFLFMISGGAPVAPIDFFHAVPT